MLPPVFDVPAPVASALVTGGTLVTENPVEEAISRGTRGA
jgi:hypothetical protein